MFGHWSCDACGAATPILPTRLTVDAARKVAPTASEETRKMLEEMIKEAEETGVY